MRKFVLIVCLLLAGSPLLAQINYVLNPGFEDHSSCKTDVDGIGIRVCNYWSAIDSLPGTSPIKWDSTLPSVFSIPVCSGEYCNTCCKPIGSGVPIGGWYHQYPHGGNAFAQLQVFVPFQKVMGDAGDYLRDYALGRLNKHLTAGHSYCVTYYIVGEEASGYAINHLGAYLDDGSIITTDSVHCAFPHTMDTPQVETDSIIYDTLNWHRVEGSFIAKGNECFITLGNFSDSAHTDYEKVVPEWGDDFVTWYLFDDISVIESDEVAHAGNDTTIVKGDTAWIGPHEIALPYMWYRLGSTTPIDSNGGIHVRPDTTTTYVVQQELCGVITYDTVTVKVVDSLSYEAQLIREHTGYTLYPNPNDGSFTIEQQREDDDPVTIILADMLGRVVRNNHVVFHNRQYSIRAASIPAGIYYIQVTDSNARVYTLKFAKQ